MPDARAAEFTNEPAQPVERSIGVGLVVPVKLLGDLLEPGLQHGRFPISFARVECRKGTNNAGLALGDNKGGARNDEQRCADDRQGKILQYGGKRHEGYFRQLLSVWCQQCADYGGTIKPCLSGHGVFGSSERI